MSSVSSVNLVEKVANPLQDLFRFSKSYDPKRIEKRENCSTHNLRKTLLCHTCKVFICDRCLVTKSDGQPEMKGAHFNHRTGQLSKMAFDILDVFKGNFETLTANLAKIQSIKPADWKLKLRAQLLSFFESIQQRVELIKNF